MLALDFINVGNGDSILIREMEDGRQKFAMLIDCGHDNLVRDDHPQDLDPRSQRIYAGDFLKKNGVEHLDVLLVTHFHRDHIGGLSRVLEAATVDRLMTTYVPPEDAQPIEFEGKPLFKSAKSALRCANMYGRAILERRDRIGEIIVFPGDRPETFQLTDDLKMDILFTEPSLYPRQKELYDAAFRGQWNEYDLVHWAKSMNPSSLRQRLYYHGKEIVLGGDLYAHCWETPSLAPCDILKVPHHATLTSTTRAFLQRLRPRVAVVSVAARRPDERPHPYIVQLLQEYVEELYFTDAVEIPGLVEPAFHESVHIEIE